MVVPFIQHIMSQYQEKITRHTKRQNKQTKNKNKNPQSEEPEQALDQDFKAIMTKKLRGLTDKVENMQEQMSISVSREVEILKKYQKIMLGIKNKSKTKNHWNRNEESL